MRNYQIGKGRDLTQYEKAVLEAIDNHPYPALARYGSLGAIKVNLRLEDSFSVKERVTIDCDKISKSLEDVKCRFKMALEHHEYQRLDEIGVQQRVLETTLDKAGQKHGIVTKEVDIPWSGAYNHGTKTVFLYMEVIDANQPIQYNPHCQRYNQTLYITYVHEMMHAYFDTKNSEKKVEEAIVEYCTLKFLEDFCNKNTQYSDMFNTALDDVYEKKTSFGCTFYGFGHYLFKNNTIDWMAEYKKLNDIYSHASTSFKDYIDKFGGSEIYPVQSEQETAKLLYNGLYNKNVTTKKSSTKSTSVTPTTFAQGTYAILQNGHVIVKANKWSDIVRKTVDSLVLQNPSLIGQMNSTYDAIHPNKELTFIITAKQYQMFVSSSLDNAASSRFFQLPNNPAYYVSSQWGKTTISEFFTIMKTLNIGIEIWKIEQEF